MARTKRANRYCVDCGSRLVYYPRLSNPKAPNEYRVLVYACPDCSNDFDKPKMFSIKRNQVENPLETVEIEIKQVQKQLQNNPKKLVKDTTNYFSVFQVPSELCYFFGLF
jgi:DNA-directed RNA polymerase subunit RPC12/RpoP